jgi:hypothetical protein
MLPWPMSRKKFSNTKQCLLNPKSIKSSVYCTNLNIYINKYAFQNVKNDGMKGK